MIPLLIGLLLAVAIFGSFLFSFARMILSEGRLRYLHGALAVLIVAAMGSISFEQPLLGLVLGTALAILGLVTAFAERRWARLLPLAGSLFGAACAVGLPFGGN